MRESDINYVIAAPDRRKRTPLCHVNLLKPYHERPDTASNEFVVQPVALSDSVSSSFLFNSTVAVEDQEDIRVPDDGVLRACLWNSDTDTVASTAATRLKTNMQS